VSTHRLRMNSTTNRARVTHATYVYCLVAHATRPPLRRSLKGVPDAGPVRLVAVDRRLWLAVSDVPREHYGESAVSRGLRDIDWVSRVAMAHEGVVESFMAATAVLPMKLFTLFADDDRAVRYIIGVRRLIDAHLARVAKHDEWGVRVALGPARARAVRLRQQTTSVTGADYLQHKKAQRDAVARRATQARDVVAALYGELARHASDARRRSDGELPVTGGPLLLDAAMLVPRARTARFRAAVNRAAKELQAEGYTVTLTGPWPPYSFVQD
jgi:hypothetical protein